MLAYHPFFPDPTATYRYPSGITKNMSAEDKRKRSRRMHSPLMLFNSTGMQLHKACIPLPIIYVVQPVILKTKSIMRTLGGDDADFLSATDSGIFSDLDGHSSGRSSPVSWKEGETGGDKERFTILTYDQVICVDNVLNEIVALEGRGNFPAMKVKLKDLLIAVRDRLIKQGLKIRDIRLNGGAASYALMPEQSEHCYVCGSRYDIPADRTNERPEKLFCSCAALEAAVSNNPNEMCSSSKSSYNDIDIIFGMELPTSKQFDLVKSAVLDAILDFLPSQVNRERLSTCALTDAYVSKMVKVCEDDRWSLIALGNGQPHTLFGSSFSSVKARSCSVELKFVDRMRRQYEFSVDSFQIVLDSLLIFYKCDAVPISSKLFPTVVGESVYGNFKEAISHLHFGVIATHNPEEIRGGGLLKYCNLLVRGYHPAKRHSIVSLQHYMCCRFFSDFPEVEQQGIKLRTYLTNHMSGVGSRLRYAFLVTLYQVVDSSTKCLMDHERRLTLELILRLASELFSNTQSNRSQKNVPKLNQASTSLNKSTPSFSTFYIPQCPMSTNSPALAGAAAASAVFYS